MSELAYAAASIVAVFVIYVFVDWCLLRSERAREQREWEFRARFGIEFHNRRGEISRLIRDDVKRVLEEEREEKR